MGTKQKLLDRLKSLPKDFTFSAPGRAPIMLHKPHPKKIMKQYAIKQLLEILTSNGDISE